MNASIRYDRYEESLPVDELIGSKGLPGERDALLTRIRALEASLECIERESEVPQLRPELSFMAVQRIGSVARQALEQPPPKSARRPLTRIRP